MPITDHFLPLSNSELARIKRGYIIEVPRIGSEKSQIFKYFWRKYEEKICNKGVGCEIQ